jgi:hypothetical protein
MGKAMFKQLVISVILGVSLLFSVALWAQNSDAKPTVVAKLDVEQQLSLSAHEASEGQFIQQLSTDKSPAMVKEEVAVPLMSALGLMVFALMYFVLRSSRRRVK